MQINEYKSRYNFSNACIDRQTDVQTLQHHLPQAAQSTARQTRRRA